MTKRIARQWALAPAAAVVALLVLSACGGGDQGDDVASAGGDANPSAEGTEQAPLDEESQALAFARCMRENGVDMPDPGPGQEGFIAALREARGEEGDDHARSVNEEYEQAFTACEAFLPEFVAEHEEAGRDQETMLALAECLRDQGLDVPDDLFGEESGGGLHDIPADELNTALEACREVAGGFSVPGGGGHGD
jgi:hypothetical protein